MPADHRRSGVSLGVRSAATAASPAGMQQDSPSGAPGDSSPEQRWRRPFAAPCIILLVTTRAHELAVQVPIHVGKGLISGAPGPSRMAAAKPGGSSLLSSSMTRGPCSGCAAKRPSSDAVAACSVCCASCAGGDSLPEQSGTRGCSVQQTWSSLMLPCCRSDQGSVLSVRDCVNNSAHPGGFERRRGRQQHRQGVHGAALPRGCPSCSGRGCKAVQQPAEHKMMHDSVEV